MKYYITADIHGFYTELHKALDEAGYFTDPEPHKLISPGDTLAAFVPAAPPHPPSVT